MLVDGECASSVVLCMYTVSPSLSQKEHVDLHHIDTSHEMQPHLPLRIEVWTTWKWVPSHLIVAPNGGKIQIKAIKCRLVVDHTHDMKNSNPSKFFKKGLAAGVGKLTTKSSPWLGATFSKCVSGVIIPWCMVHGAWCSNVDCGTDHSWWRHIHTHQYDCYHLAVTYNCPIRYGKSTHFPNSLLSMDTTLADHIYQVVVVPIGSMIG